MRVTLVWSTAQLVRKGTPIVGCPILLTDGKLEPAPSLWFVWLHEHNSGDTRDTYAAALALWWRALLLKKIAWQDVVASDLDEWQAPRTCRSATALLRCTAVVMFYKWAKQVGLIEHLPFTLARSSRNRSLAKESDSADTPRVPRPRADKYRFRTSTVAEFNATLAANPRVSETLRFRDELMAECGRFVGLRAMEVALMNRGQIAGLNTDDDVHAVSIRRKRGKIREVLFPRMLVHRLQRYVALGRQEAIHRGRETYAHYQDPECLFLTDDGRPIPREYVSKIWRRASLAARIPSRFHVNRHTHLTLLADAADAAGLDALEVARQQGGHASKDTTAKYVHRAELIRTQRTRALIVNDLYEAYRAHAQNAQE